MTSTEWAAYLRDLAAQEQAPAPREAMQRGAVAIQVLRAFQRAASNLTTGQRSLIDTTLGEWGKWGQ